MKAILALLALVAVASAHVLVPATGLTTVGTVYPGVSYTSKVVHQRVPTVQYPVYKYPQYQYVYQPVQNKVVYPSYSYGSVPLYGNGNTAYYLG